MSTPGALSRKYSTKKGTSLKVDTNDGGLIKRRLPYFSVIPLHSYRWGKGKGKGKGHD